MRKLILLLPEVEHRTGYKRSSIYAMQRKGCFPHSFRLGPNRVAWLVEDVDQWLNDRIAKHQLEKA